jgi:hypothetical protein
MPIEMSDNASAEPLQMAAEQGAACDRLPLAPTVSEDEFHEAWRRGGEEYSRRHLEQLQAEIIAGGR